MVLELVLTIKSGWNHFGTHSFICDCAINCGTYFYISLYTHNFFKSCLHLFKVVLLGCLAHASFDTLHAFLIKSQQCSVHRRGHK